jgi:hypothetical protein
MNPLIEGFIIGFVIGNLGLYFQRPLWQTLIAMVLVNLSLGVLQGLIVH